MFDDFNEFDIALALYHWLQHNWEGQSDPLYGAFCLLTEPGMYKPAHSEEVFENIDEMAKMIYDELNYGNYQEALNKVLGYVPEDERE